MFRWTAGTKARADRAARQHKLSGAPSRLLLASRPPHTLLRARTSPSSTKVQTGNAPQAASSHKPLLKPTGEDTGEVCETALSFALDDKGFNDLDTNAPPATPPMPNRELDSVSAVDAPLFAEQQRTPASPLRTTTIQQRTSLLPLASPKENASPSSHFSTADCPLPTASSLQPSVLPSPQLTPLLTQQAVPANSSISSQPCTSTSSLSQADRLVHAMLAAQRKRLKRSGVNHHQYRRRHRQQSGSCAFTAEMCFTKGKGEPVAESVSETSSLSDGEGSSFSCGTDVDTYTKLQHQQQQRAAAVAKARLRWLSDETTPLTAGTLKSAVRWHDRAKETQQQKTKEDERYRAAPPAVSVDCVSVQLPLRGGSNAAVSTAADFEAPSAVTAATSASQPTQNWHRGQLCTAQQSGRGREGRGAAFEPTWRSDGAGGQVLDDAALLVVATDTHQRCCSIDNGADCSSERAAPLDVSLFQNAAERPAFFAAAPSTAERAVHLPLLPALENSVGGGAHGCVVWNAAPPNLTQDAHLFSSCDFEDQPLGWPAQQSPASWSLPHPCRDGRRERKLWTMPFNEDEQRSSEMAACAPFQPLTTSWPLPSPPPPSSATGAVAAAPALSAAPVQRFMCSAEHDEMDGVFCVDLYSEPRPPKRMRHPLPIPPASSEVGDVHQRGGRVTIRSRGAWSAPLYPSLPFSFSATASGVPVAARPDERSSFAGSLWLPLRPAHHNGREQPQHRKWPNLQSEDGAQPLFPQPMQRFSSEVRATHCTSDSILRSGNNGAVGNSGGHSGRGRGRGRGRDGRQALPRVLNGTTERCRRFWERCRHPPDVDQPPSSRFF